MIYLINPYNQPYLFALLFFHLYLSIYLPFYLFISLSSLYRYHLFVIYLFIYLSFLCHLFIYLSTYLFLFIHSNCVGIGNRRLFWILLFFKSSFLCIYFLCSKYLHHTYYCQDNNVHNIYFLPKTLKAYFIYWIKNSFILYYFEFFDVFFGKELYVLQKYPGFYGLSCISFLLGCYLAALLQV